MSDNETVYVYATVTADSPFSASELKLTYDANLLTFDQSKSTLNGAAVTNKNGVLELIDYGAEQSSYTFAFKAASAGNANVTLNTAKFGTSKDAASKDLTAAAISNGTLSVTINHPVQKVELPSILSGDFFVAYGADYTFSLADDSAFYNYSAITATIAGETADVIPNSDGTYTVENVTGTLVLSASRTPKSFAVDFQTTTDAALPNDTTAVYGTDFTFTVPKHDLYTTSIASICYKTNNASVPHRTNDDGTITILGENIIDDIVIVINSALTEVAVTVEGDAASDVLGYATTAKIGEAYTLTVHQDDKYSYTVDAAIGEQAIALTVANNTYTIPAESITATAGSITFTVTKTLKIEVVTATPYLTLENDTTLWLIQIPVAKSETMVYSYNGSNLFWSEEYNAYCTVVASAEEPVFHSENLTLVSGAAVVSDNSMDINGSGKIDANDAQFVYNMYNKTYHGITDEVNIEKFLRADVNHDGVINVADAVAIVNYLLNIA